jgi:hypothetical protein
MAQDKKNTAIYVAYDEHEAVDPAMPERNLLRAILTTAMSDLKKPGEPSRKAVEYFLSPDDEYIFSFVSVCNFLEIDPKRVLKVTGLLDGAKRTDAAKQSSKDEAASLN